MKRKTLYSVKMRSSFGQQHISGAEGIYGREEVSRIVSAYCERALRHPKGRPNEIALKVRILEQMPLLIPSLRVCTVDVASTGEAKKILGKILDSLGISRSAIQKAFDIVYSRNFMRGAAVLSRGNGKRLDPNRKRGVRATELGITRRAAKTLTEKLKPYNLNSDTVKEALILASKISSFDGVAAELCVSDDPDYTTGYVASSPVGYVRIPHIKRQRENYGGRVIFVRDDLDMQAFREYLEETPALVTRIGRISGKVSIDEFFGGSPR